MTVENDSSQVQVQAQSLSGSGFPRSRSLRDTRSTSAPVRVPATRSPVLPLGAYVSIHCQCDGTTV
ncbi:hypothetical protein ACFSNO_17880, partial [Streptomyces cirratus]